MQERKTKRRCKVGEHEWRTFGQIGRTIILQRCRKCGDESEKDVS